MIKTVKITILLLLFSFGSICFAEDLTFTVAYNNIFYREDLTITVVYNNVPYDSRLSTAWGISCFNGGLEKTILFDTGGNGQVLLANMEKTGIAPKEVEIVFLSHIHEDHAGGLWDLLQKKRSSNCLCA